MTPTFSDVFASLAGAFLFAVALGAFLGVAEVLVLVLKFFGIKERAR